MCSKHSLEIQVVMMFVVYAVDSNGEIQVKRDGDVYIIVEGPQFVKAHCLHVFMAQNVVNGYVAKHVSEELYLLGSLDNDSYCVYENPRYVYNIQAKLNHIPTLDVHKPIDLTIRGNKDITSLYGKYTACGWEITFFGNQYLTSILIKIVDVLIVNGVASI